MAPGLTMDDILPAAPAGTQLSMEDIVPSMPAPSSSPTIDLESGDSQVGVMDRIKGGTFFPTDSRQNEIFLQNQGYQTQRSADGALLVSADGKTFQPVQQSLLDNPISESAIRLASAGGELVKMVGMGAGATAGTAVGAAGGPVGAVGLGALGAGAGYNAGGRAMAQAGSMLFGVPPESDEEMFQQTMGDVAMGGGGQLIGPPIAKGLGQVAAGTIDNLGLATGGVVDAAGKVAGGAINKSQELTRLLLDKLDKVQAYEKLVSIFGIDPKVVGKGVMEAAEAGVKAPVPHNLAVENPIHEVFDHLNPLFHEAVARAPIVGKNEIATLGEITAQKAGLSGVLVQDSIDKLSKTPAGKAISLTQLRAVGQQSIQDMKLAGGHVTSVGANIGSTGQRIDQHLGGALEQFIDGFVIKATNESQELAAQIAQLTPQLAKQPNLAPIIQKMQADKLLADAQIMDPKAPLSDIWRFYGEMQDKGLKSFQGKTNTPDLVEAFGQFGTAISKEVDNLALGIDPKIGSELVAAKKDYSLFRDAQNLISKAVGEASMQKGPVTGLQAGERLITDAKSGISRIIRSTGGRAKQILFQPYTPPPLTPSQEFVQATRVLPTTIEQGLGAQYRGARFSEMAEEVMNKPITKMVTGTAIASRAMNLFIPEDASAEANLAPLRDAMTLSLLVDNGLAPPEARETGLDANSVPPEIMQQVGQSIMMTLQPLNDALKFGSEEEIGAAYSQVVKQFPELFPPPKTGIKGEVEDSQGNIKLYDPTDRARYMAQIQVDSSIGWDEKAKTVSELNSTFTVRNPRKPK